MHPNTNKNYFVKATQSLFMIAGIIMIFTFPRIFSAFSPSFLVFNFALVLMAILAGFASKNAKLVLKFSVLVSILGFIFAASRSIDVFFISSEDPILIFTFWMNQILAIIFFMSIYFSIRALKTK